MRSSAFRRCSSTCCAALLAGCSFTAFDDFEAKAPAVKIEQQGDRQSAAFGVHVAAMPRRQVGKLINGGALLVTGNSPVAVNTVAFGVDGRLANSEADNDAFMRFLGEPDQITALAPAPSDVPPSTFGGPFAYLGLARKGVGSLNIVDVNSYDGPSGLSAPRDDVQAFASGVAPADFGGDGGRRPDLAIGARGAVVLWRATAWPSFSAPEDAVVVSSGGAWPVNASFTALASGQLERGQGDQVAVGAPEGNFVAVLSRLGDVGTEACVDVCATVLPIPLPGSASGFGSALLLADVDDDGRDELVVGAPGTAQVGAVYVYDLAAAHLDGTEPVPEPRVIKAPAGAASFGAGLAAGRFDGKQLLLAIGAPGSEVDGQAKAGAVYLYGGDLDKLVGTVRLARPEAKGQLGGALAAMPFKGTETVNDVLVASGATAAYVFFASVTPEHEDVRAR